MLGLWKNIGVTAILFISVRSLGSQPVGECGSARGAEDTLDGSSQGKSPCLVDRAGPRPGGGGAGLAGGTGRRAALGEGGAGEQRCQGAAARGRGGGGGWWRWGGAGLWRPAATRGRGGRGVLGRREEEKGREGEGGVGGEAGDGCPDGDVGSALAFDCRRNAGRYALVAMMTHPSNPHLNALGFSAALAHKTLFCQRSHFLTRRGTARKYYCVRCPN